MVKEGYKLQGNPVIENVPTVGNLVYDDLGKAVIAKLNERFEGVQGIAYDADLKEGDVIRYSNTPRALAINQILREETGGDIHVLSDEEVVKYWNHLPERDSTYADTDGVAVYPKEGPNESLRQKVLGIVGKNSTRVPLVVSGLGVVKDATEDLGFTFTETGNILVREAQYLKQDGKVVYDVKEGKLKKSDKGVNIWTPSPQNGLRRLCRNGNGRLVANFDVLLDAVDNGRVQILQDPQGLDEKISEMSGNLDQQRDAELAKIHERYQMAQEVLRTGKLS